MGKSNHAGFSLIELLLVISIIGILTSILLPSLQVAREKARVSNALLELRSIQTTLENLNDDTGLYSNAASSLCRSTLPSSNEIDLSTDNAGLVANGLSWAGWKGPYLSDVEDPWGNPYFLDEDYQCMSSTTGCGGIADSGTDSSVLVSCGPNGDLSTDACEYDGDNVVVKLCDSG